VGSPPRLRCAHQPRDAALRPTAPPPPVDHLPATPALRRGRRAALVPRRVRRPRRAGAAPAAQSGPLAGRRPHAHRLLRHHRRPVRAGRLSVG
jgi:hypothetical protein